MPEPEKPFTLQITPKDGQAPIVTMVLGEGFTTVLLSDGKGKILEQWKVEGEKLIVENLKYGVEEGEDGGED
ncbi:hypothetical protein AUJ17_03355 [Candidatus Micrarchaeota archaeon CG1_02_47_40]|nr:MAG: hypothetical protein AUJ17_03355 [Candidatus Micrarchaeota archaeon CG1_02_47_40]